MGAFTSQGHVKCQPYFLNLYPWHPLPTPTFDVRRDEGTVMGLFSDGKCHYGALIVIKTIRQYGCMPKFSAHTSGVR